MTVCSREWLVQCGHHRPGALGESCPRAWSTGPQGWNPPLAYVSPSNSVRPTCFLGFFLHLPLLSHPYTYSSLSWGKCPRPPALSHTFNNTEIYNAEFNSVPRVTLSQVNCYYFLGDLVISHSYPESLRNPQILKCSRAKKDIIWCLTLSVSSPRTTPSPQYTHAHPHLLSHRS